MGYYEKFRKLTDQEVAERDGLIFGSYDPEEYYGGVRRFCDVSPETVAKLIEKGYADPDDTQNDSPSIQEFLDYCEQHPEMGLTLGGYVVSKDRGDCRVTIDGIVGELPTGASVSTANAIAGIVSFYERFRYADELEAVQGTSAVALSAWYD